ncbi:protein kinase [Clostridia bacterium]|nr:protein kinase [Clostridia bacterium]
MNLIGKVFSKRYEVKKRIGAGGMSIVYLAEDILLNRSVAVKILRDQYADDDRNIRFFQNEARSIAALSHPNIVKIYDIGKEDQYYFIVMEYLEGETLKEVIQDKAPMNPIEAINLIRSILKALEHSHKKGIIHRDIKPHNIMLDKAHKVKVTDFGIARNAGASTVTYSGQMVGSVYYISPEQAKGERTTFATDIYSTGAMLYEMLTGKVPFTGSNPVSIALSHVEKQARPMSDFNKKVPECLEEIVETAMMKNPKDRYSSAMEMARALTQAKMLIESGKAKVRKERIKIGKWKWLGVLAGLFAILIPISMAVANYFAPVAVPDVVGKPRTEAESILTDAGFAFKIDRTIVTTDFEADIVMHQDPKADQKVKTSRTILLTLSEQPELFIVPDVVGKMERIATVAIENARLKTVIVHDYSSDITIPVGAVIKQEPQAGSKLLEDSEIVLTISDGIKPGLITMEDLKGKTFAEAEDYLKTNNLKMGEISYESSPLYFLGTVMDQSVVAKTEIPSGTTVNIVISRGPGIEVQEKEISFTLPGIKMSEVTIVVTDLSGTHEEYRDNHNGGEPLQLTIKHWGEGSASVYQDDQLIMTVDLP